MPPTREEVREAYKKNFEELRDSAGAWNRTLDQFFPIGPGTSEEEMNERHKVADILHDIQRKVDLELGDPFELAVRDAMKQLRRDRITNVAKEEWKKVLAALREQLKTEPTREIVHPPPGPKEWWPGMKREKRVERRRKTMDEMIEQLEGPNLYILFTNKGVLDGWTIDYPDYFRGHGGPIAVIPVSDRITYAEIESEVGNTLGEWVDWESLSGGD